MESLSGQAAIVTGGGSGIGRAIAESLVRAGINVMISSRRGDLLEREADALTQVGPGNAAGQVCDLRDESSINALSHAAQERFGRVDILVNNSGIGVGSTVAETSTDDWDRVMDTNLKGAFLLTRAVLPAMIERRSGQILSISSQAGKHGYAKAGVYCASKFGLLGLMAPLQEEVREFGIRVHCLCPGLVQVPPPSGDSEIREGVLQVEDLAAAAMFVLTQPRRVRLEDIGLFQL